MTSASPNGAAPPYTCPAPSSTPPASAAPCHKSAAPRAPGSSPSGCSNRSPLSTAIVFSSAIQNSMYRTAAIYHLFPVHFAAERRNPKTHYKQTKKERPRPKRRERSRKRLPPWGKLSPQATDEGRRFLSHPLPGNPDCPATFPLGGRHFFYCLHVHHRYLVFVTKYRLNSRFGSCIRRYSHSKLCRCIHIGARRMLPAS